MLLPPQWEMPHRWLMLANPEIYEPRKDGQDFGSARFIFVKFLFLPGVNKIISCFFLILRGEIKFMKKTVLLSLGAAAVALSLLTGCQTEGCTDPTAVNYESTADVNDGSCNYEGEVVFWYNAATSQEVIDFFGQSLLFYVNGQLIGSTSASVYWTGAPDCGQNASITYTGTWQNNTSKTVSYEVWDEDGYQWWSGTITLNANNCLALQLL